MFAASATPGAIDGTFYEAQTGNLIGTATIVPGAEPVVLSDGQTVVSQALAQSSLATGASDGLATEQATYNAALRDAYNSSRIFGLIGAAGVLGPLALFALPEAAGASYTPIVLEGGAAESAVPPALTAGRLAEAEQLDALWLDRQGFVHADSSANRQRGFQGYCW